jgi:hypothetical protein
MCGSMNCNTYLFIFDLIEKLTRNKITTNFINYNKHFSDRVFFILSKNYILIIINDSAQYVFILIIYFQHIYIYIIFYTYY